jgi:hypothetical protein
MKKINRSETKMRKASKVIDILILIAGILLAAVVIGLSFNNTANFAAIFGVNPYLAAGVVEFMFALLLGIRGYQRATQRNVPLFLEIGYFFFFAIVTAVNMYGLGSIEPVLGHIAGLVISGAMWLMETTLVWWLTKKDLPYTKSIRERLRDAKRDINEEKAIQRIEWMKWEAKKPDLKLIKEARKFEEQRKKVIGDGLPEFFNQPIPQPEVHEVIATTVQEEQSNQAEVVPFKRQIGFFSPDTTEVIEAKAETQEKDHLFKPNTDARQQAIQTANDLMNRLGRIPTKKELMEEGGLSDHYARIAKKSIDTK